MDENDTLYTEAEVLKVLLGLMNVYWGKSWFGRILYKPWHDALQTAALILAPTELAKVQDIAEFLDDIDQFMQDGTNDFRTN